MTEVSQMLAEAEAFEALQAAATPGPWIAATGDDRSQGYMYDVLCEADIAGARHTRTLLQLNWNFPENLANDREFIAASRSTRLASHVRELAEENARLRKALADERITVVKLLDEVRKLRKALGEIADTPRIVIAVDSDHPRSIAREALEGK